MAKRASRTKIPAKIKSVSDLLVADDVAQAFSEALKVRGNLSAVVIIAKDRQGELYSITSGLEAAEYTHLLQTALFDFLSGKG